MFDTMRFTKVVGALCGSLLVFMLTSWVASALFYTGGGYGGESEAQAYIIDTGEGDAETETAEAGPDFEVIFASADADAGARVFNKCASCHKMDGTDITGPHLNGIVDGAKAASPGFGYSAALLEMASDTWTPANLNAFLESPKGYMPGTKMAFAGLPRPQERADLIAWLAAQP